MNSVVQLSCKISVFSGANIESTFIVEIEIPVAGAKNLILIKYLWLPIYGRVFEEGIYQKKKNWTKYLQI